jgi:hypothetical protein
LDFPQELPEDVARQLDLVLVAMVGGVTHR